MTQDSGLALPEQLTAKIEKVLGLDSTDLEGDEILPVPFATALPRAAFHGESASSPLHAPKSPIWRLAGEPEAS